MAARAVDYRSEWSRLLRVNGARVSEIQYDSIEFCTMHWHSRPSLGIVLQGEISKEFAKSSILIESNGGFAMPAGILHTDHFGAGTRIIMIEIDASHPLSIERLKVCAPVFDHWIKIDDHRIGAIGRRIASELHQADSATMLAVDSLIGEALSIATRRASQTPGDSVAPHWLLQARDIARRSLNRRVTVAEIATQVGVHPAYLARRFRDEFGVTPGTYARNARLHWAAERLIRTDLAIAEIAIQAGFADQSHFTRAFRRFINQTPAQYRDRYRQSDRA